MTQTLPKRAGSDHPPVLVVDDSTELLDSLRRTIGDVFDVTVAVDGVEALTLVARFGSPPVVLVDHFMPRMTGAELVTRLAGCSPSTVCVMLTGNPRDPEVLTAAELPSVLRVLAKPVDTDTLLEALHMALRVHESRSANQPAFVGD